MSPRSDEGRQGVDHLGGSVRNDTHSRHLLQTSMYLEGLPWLVEMEALHGVFLEGNGG